MVKLPGLNSLMIDQGIKWSVVIESLVNKKL